LIVNLAIVARSSPTEPAQPYLSQATAKPNAASAP